MNEYTGKQFGNYQLLRRLGQGGSASVYLGEQKFLGTQAAIKVLHAHLDDKSKEAFLAEARALADLKHPNIVRMVDFGVEESEPYLIMEYASQGSLRDKYPQETRLSLSMLLPYIAQVADALDYAHSRKFVHRDIKPENLLLRADGTVLLSDFGVAKLLRTTSQYTHNTGITGTATYMAPEQIQGKASAASDQYALAVTTYEWLCGHPPFSGSFSEVCSNHMFAPVPSIRSVDPTLPEAIDEILQTALAKDPKNRFPNVRAFAYKLQQAHLPQLHLLSSREALPAAENVALPPMAGSSQNEYDSTAPTYVSPAYISPTYVSPNEASSPSVHAHPASVPPPPTETISQQEIALSQSSLAEKKSGQVKSVNQDKGIASSSSGRLSQRRYPLPLMILVGVLTLIYNGPIERVHPHFP